MINELTVFRFSDGDTRIRSKFNTFSVFIICFQFYISMYPDNTAKNLFSQEKRNVTLRRNRLVMTLSINLPVAFIKTSSQKQHLRTGSILLKCTYLKPAAFLKTETTQQIFFEILEIFTTLIFKTVFIFLNISR